MLTDVGVIAMVAAVLMAFVGIVAGWTIGKTGSAGIEVCRLNPKLSGQVLVFAALEEGVAIYGMLVAFLLTIKI